MTYEEMQHLIATSPADTKFRNSSSAPTPEATAEVENLLGVPLPPGYKWFLANYAGGRVAGDEIFAIGPAHLRDHFGEDIVYQYRWHTQRGFLEPYEVPLMTTDFAELHYFDTREADPDGEYPILCNIGGDRLPYANNFLEFLEKIIAERLPQ